MRRTSFVLGLLTLAVVSRAQVEVVYDKLWGGSLEDTFAACAVDGFGNAFVNGFATATASEQFNRVIRYSQTGSVVWSKNVAAGDSGSAFLSLQGADNLIAAAKIGPNRFVLTSLKRSNGSSNWNTFVNENLEAITTMPSSVAVAQTDSFGRLRVTYFNLAGLAEWNVDRGNTTVVRLAPHPSGDVFIMHIDSQAVDTVVSRLSRVDGSALWTRRYPLRFGSIDTLLPSGNLVVGLGDGLGVEILDGGSGATLRQDVTPTGESLVVASKGDSYYVQSGNFSTVVEYRDRNGYLLGATNVVQGFTKRVVDGSGSLLAATAVTDTATFIQDLVLDRRLNEFRRSFPIGRPTVVLDIAAAGAFAAVCGFATIPTNNRQGRLTLFRQDLVVASDTFQYRKGQFLDVEAPGVLANDAGWELGVVSISQPPQNGSLSFRSDGSFRYVPNVGFFLSDSFQYSIRLGSAVQTGVVTLNPAKLRNVIPLLNGFPVTEVVGGTNLKGAVQMFSPHPFHRLVVQNFENISGLAVTSSNIVPQGQTLGGFDILTVPVSTDQTGVISTRLDGETVSVPFTVRRAVPESLTLSPTAVVGGQSFTGTIRMTGNAPTAGLVVNVTHSGVEITTPFVNVVAAGSNTVSFVGTTQPRSTSVTHLVTATSGGVSATANITLNPGGLFAFTITPTTVRGGTPANGRVQTAGVAPAGGTSIAMTKSGGSVSVPPTVTVPAGAQFKNFTMNTAVVTTTLVRTITATFGTVVRAQTLTITP